MNRFITIFLATIMLVFIYSSSLTIYATNELDAAARTYEIAGSSGKITTTYMEDARDIQYDVNGIMCRVQNRTYLTVPSSESGGLIELDSQVGGKNTSILVLKRDEATGDFIEVPMATWVQKDENGEITNAGSLAENISSRKYRFYAEPGEEYVVVHVADDGGDLFEEVDAQTGIVINYNRVNVPEGAEIYNTDMTASNTYAQGVNNYSIATVGKEGFETGSEIIYINTDADPYKSQGVQTITQDELQNYDSNLGNSVQNAQNASDEYNTSAFEKMLSWFVVKGVGDNLRKAFSLALGDNISIDDLLFNHYPNTRLSIFNSNREAGNKNAYLENSGLLDGANGSKGILTRYFIIFRNIALSFYLVILLYMGVRILLSSTGGSKAKYKSMIMDWVVGLIMIAVLPYVMKYIIVVNDAIVSYIEDTKEKLPSDVVINLPTIQGLTSEEALAFDAINADKMVDNGDLMEGMRLKALATGKLAYAMIYIFLIKELLGFILIYFKRLINTMFLIVISPLIMISYAADKIRDGKSQTVNKWIKEYTLNVFLQAFQAVNYVVVMSVVFALSGSSGNVNVIFTLIALSYISKGDVLLRGLFSRMSGGGANSLPRSISEAVKTVATVKIAKSLVSKVGSVGGRIGNVAKKATNVRDSYRGLQESHLQELQSEQIMAEQRRAEDPNSAENREINNASLNINVALNISGARSPEEVKKALDNLAILRNDPNRKHLFETEYNRLSASEKQKLNKLMAANSAINETINNNTGTNGGLTEREINLNFSIIADIIDEELTGDYKDLYKFMDGKKILDDNGNEVGGLMDYFKSQEKGRNLDLDDSFKLKRSQRIFGNVSGINTGNRVLAQVDENTGRVQGTRIGANNTDTSRRTTSYGTGARLYTLTNEEREEAQTRRSSTILSDAGVAGTSNARAMAAADTIATVMEYDELIGRGAIDGMKAEEGLELAARLKKLKQESIDAGDAETRRVIDEFEKKVGFGIDEFEASAAVTAIVDNGNISGSLQEKQDVLNEAYKIVRRVKQSSDNAVALATVNRAELDRVISGEIHEGMMFTDTEKTEEQYRTSKTIEQLRRTVAQEYKDTDRTTVGQARGEFLKSVGDLIGASASVVNGMAGIGAGMAASAFYAGVSGKTDPTNLLGAADIGVSAEHAVESLVPGTVYSGKGTVGGKIDSAVSSAVNSKFKVTEAQRLSELNARMYKKQNAKNNIKSYERRIR